jgi:transporter protein
LAITLIASKKTEIVGKYKHSNILFLLGWVVVVVTAYIGVQSLSKLAELFA